MLYVWNRADSVVLLPTSYVVIFAVYPSNPPGIYMLPSIIRGDLPTHSAISISPQLGQSTFPRFMPSVHIAGQDPAPTGILALTSILPYKNCILSLVMTLAEV